MLSLLLRKLSQPHRSVQDSRLLLKYRFSNLFLIILVLGTLVDGLLSHGNQEDRKWFLLTLSLFFTITYLLGRSRHFKISGYLFTIGLYVGPILGPFSGLEYQDASKFLVLALLAGWLFMGGRKLTLLFIWEIASLLTTYHFLDAVDIDQAIHTIMFLTTCFAVIKIASQLSVMDQEDIISQRDKLLFEVQERSYFQNLQEQSKSMLKLVLDRIPAKVFWKDQNLTYLGSNSFFSEGLGLASEEELIGKTDEMLYDHERAVHYQESDHNVLLQESPTYEETKKVGSTDKDVTWFGINKIPLIDQGAKLFGILGMISDITERKLSEERTIENEKEYRLLIDFFPEALLIHHEGRVVYANNAAIELFEAGSQEEFYGYKVFDLIAPEHLDTIKQRLSQLNKIGDRVGGVEERVITVKKNSIIVEVSSLKIYFEGKLSNMVVARDVSARAETLRLLQEAKERAEEASQMKSRFLANTSHEIRTPLNAILGFSELLELELTDQKNLDMAAAIHHSGQTLLKLINDILDLSKVESGKIKLSPEWFSPVVLIGDICHLLCPTAEEKGLEWSEEIDSNLPQMLFADELRLRQIFMNLISNAVKFSEKGSISLRLHCVISADQKSAELVFAVQDTGIGINKASRESIFAPFCQQDGQNTRKYGGSGLGLAICKRLIGLMKGEIELTSIVDQGSCFEVHIPDLPLEMSVSTVNGPILPSEPKRLDGTLILVVDDEMYNRLVLVKGLERLGAEVIEAENGEEAIHMVEKQKPKFIIMDVLMPVMDGREAAGILKSKPETSHIPLIAYTAATLPKIDNLKEDGFDYILQKPSTFDQILAVVGSCTSIDHN